MLRYDYFADNWLDVSNLLKDEGNLYVTLQPSFLSDLKFDNHSFKQYRINAAKNIIEKLGSKPALCFSGGIDSQATWQCFNEAGIDIDVYSLVFKNGLNKQDVTHAILFADKNNIKLNFIEIDVINFLSRENAEYGKKYKSLSPHFNTHYKLCDILLSKGYTGFVCGGGSPLLTKDIKDYASNYTQNFLNYINYSQIANTYCQGNFLGYDPYLAWSISLSTPIFQNDTYGIVLTQEDRDRLEYQRYLEKIEGYRQAGFKIIPQTKKYTGFELVKQELEKMYGDGWAFENKFREPLRFISPYYQVKINFTNDFIDGVKKLYAEKSATSQISCPGI